MKPLIQGNENTSLSQCPVCGSRYEDNDHRFVVFTAGALRRVGEHSAEMDSQLTGFMDLFWHDHAHGGACIPLAEDAPAGQVELYVCSPHCLRALFNQWVDALEARICATHAAPEFRPIGDVDALESMTDQMNKSTAQAGAAIDDALASVEASNLRIAAMEPQKTAS